MSSLRSSLIAMFAATVLILGASACSGDDTSSAGDSTASADTGSASDDTDSAENDTDAEVEEDAVPQASKDEVVEGIKAMSQADSVDFDGTAMELTYSEGSRDLPALVFCSSSGFQGADWITQVVLIYPDGNFVCPDQPEG